MSPPTSRPESTWSFARARPGELTHVRAALQAGRRVTIGVRTIDLSGSDPRLVIGVELANGGEIVSYPDTIDIRTRRPLTGMLGNATARWMRTKRNTAELPWVDSHVLEPREGLVDITVEAMGETEDAAEVEVWAEIAAGAI